MAKSGVLAYINERSAEGGEEGNVVSDVVYVVVNFRGVSVRLGS